MCRILLLVLFFAFSMGSINAQKKRSGRSLKHAREYYDLADSLYSAGVYDSAARNFYEAAKIFEKKSEWLEAVKCYYIRSECFYNSNDFDTALVIANISLSILTLQGLDETYDGFKELIKILTLLGWIHTAEENFDQALRLFLEGIEITSHNHDTLDYYFMAYYRASLFYSIGQVYAKQGNYNNSIGSFTQALIIYKKLHGENYYRVAQTYSNIGGVYLYKRDYEKAKNYLIKSQKVLRLLYGEKSIEYAGILINLALLYNNIDETIRAKSHLEEALSIYNKIYSENNPRFIIIYNNLAELCFKSELFDEALCYYFKAKEICKKNEYSGLIYNALIDNNIALLYYAKHNFKKALHYFQNALKYRVKIYNKKHFRVAQTHYYLGRTYIKLSQTLKGLESFQDALIAVCPEFNDTSFLSNPEINLVCKEIDVFNILCEKAYALHLFYKMNNDSTIYLCSSIETYRLALDMLDVIRGDYSSNESKILFLGNNKQKLLNATLAFDEVIIEDSSIIMEDYFTMSERLKAFVLFTSMNELKIKKIAGIPDSIIGFENNLQRDISLMKTNLQKLKFLNDENDALKIKEIENEIFQLTEAKDSLINHYKRAYPNYFDLKHISQIPSVKDIQSKLSKSEIIVDYLINDTLLYILTISSSEYKVTKTTIGNDFQKRVIEYFQHLKKAGNDTQFAYESSYLFNKLIYPVKECINDKSRLIIIPDEYLAYIPFETLVDNEVKDEFIIDLCKMNYLLNDFEVVYNNSASLWWNARMNTLEDSENTDSKKPISESFIGFAPVFNNVNSNNDFENKECDSTNYNLVHRSFSLGSNRFLELPYSKEEVEQINDLFIKKGCLSEVLLNQNATKHSFLHNIKDYKYVHIATHGFSNDKYSELCGLVFYPDDSRKCNNENEAYQGNDFFDQNILFAGEMYGLDINADLLVLSACETGIGKLAKGEGLLAMTRGFLHSGVGNILFSLWKVSDQYTRYLMISFYKYILSSHSYSNALRLAKLDLVKRSEYLPPKFWSSFLLIGE